MTALLLIEQNTIFVSPETKTLEAINLFNNGNHIPVIENNTCIGYLDRESIEFALDDGIELISDCMQEIKPCPTVIEDCHFYEIIKVLNTSQSPILTVLGNDGKYLGFIDYKSIIKFQSGFYSSSQLGSVIVIEIEPKDLSLSHLIRIIENNDARVLGIEINESPSNQKLLVHLKLNTGILKSVLAGLQRQDYLIYAHFMRQDVNTEEDEMRFKLLLNYLDLD